MVSVIRKLHPDGKITIEAVYTLPPQRALICAIKQLVEKDWQTWTYPEMIDKIWQGSFGNMWYFDQGDYILSASAK